MPIIEDVMTKSPKVISHGAPLSEASEIMRACNIRHLPVVNIKGEVIGMISERDIRLVNSLPRNFVCTVDDVMTPSPYIVQKGAPLTQVILEMRVHKYGAAIVVDDIGQVCGVFTTIDALSVLSDLVRRTA
jgi:CBS domain-containing protein